MSGETISDNNAVNDNYNQWATLEQELSSDSAEEEAGDNWRIATEGAIEMLNELDSIAVDTEPITTVLRSAEVLQPLLDKGISLKDALDGKLLYDEHYYDDGVQYDGPSDSQDYIDDVAASIPVLSSYFGENVPASDKKMMERIILKRADGDLSLSEIEKKFLSGRDDVIANRILFGNKDLSAERVQKIISGLDWHLEEAAQNHEKLSQSDISQEYVDRVLNHRIVDAIDFASTASEDFLTTEDPEIMDRYNTIQSKIQAVVADERIYQSLMREATWGGIKSFNDTAKAIILDYAANDKIPPEWEAE